MPRLIIYVTGKPNLHGHKRREFLWSPAHKLYLYGGSEISAEAFNEIYEKAMKTNADMNPRVKVVDAGATVAIQHVTFTTPPAPQEITEEQAVAVLQRLAPELLKKKPGRKAADVALEVA